MFGHWAYFKRDVGKLEHVQRNIKRVMRNCEYYDMHPREVNSKKGLNPVLN